MAFGMFFGLKFDTVADQARDAILAHQVAGSNATLTAWGHFLTFASLDNDWNHAQKTRPATICILKGAAA
ncbi:MAG: hypothetical protein Q6373_021465 [Candidatus Sigynarchaeota archaeon]